MLLGKGATFTVLNKAKFLHEALISQKGCFWGKAPLLLSSTKPTFCTKYFLHKGMFKEDLAADTFKQKAGAKQERIYMCVPCVCVAVPQFLDCFDKINIIQKCCIVDMCINISERPCHWQCTENKKNVCWFFFAIKSTITTPFLKSKTT